MYCNWFVGKLLWQLLAVKAHQDINKETKMRFFMYTCYLTFPAVMCNVNQAFLLKRPTGISWTSKTSWSHCNTSYYLTYGQCVTNFINNVQKLYYWDLQVKPFVYEHLCILGLLHHLYMQWSMGLLKEHKCIVNKD